MAVKCRAVSGKTREAREWAGTHAGMTTCPRTHMPAHPHARAPTCPHIRMPAQWHFHTGARPLTCLPASPHVHGSACRLAPMPACLLARPLHASVRSWLHACMPAHPRARISACPHSGTSTQGLALSLACLPAHMSTGRHASLPLYRLACLPDPLHASVRSCLHACMPARSCMNLSTRPPVHLPIFAAVRRVRMGAHAPACLHNTMPAQRVSRTTSDDGLAVRCFSSKGAMLRPASTRRWRARTIIRQGTMAAREWSIRNRRASGI